MNRLTVLSLLLVPALAQAAYTCDPNAQPAEIQQAFGVELERLHAEQKAAETAHQAELTSRADDLVRTGAWTAADRGKFFQDLMLDETFKAEEAIKADYLAAFMASLQAAERASGKDPAAVCKHADDALATFGEIRSSSERQWQYMKAQMALVPPKIR
ncbi:hypothetical protein [Lysobacter humi (ex Lee et al. 2017)]